MLEPPPTSESPWQRTRVRAPGGDETYLSLPPLPEAAPLAAANSESLAVGATNIQGRDLSLLRGWTRHEVLRAAGEYTARLLDTTPTEVTARLPDPMTARWYVGGHQPALFHRGVWVKNFAVSALASADQGIGLNLVVDNDTMPSTGIVVPVGNRDQPRTETVLFDEPRSTRPWEEARVVDQSMFASFPERVASRMRGWGFEPLLGEFWSVARRHAENNQRLADCLTAARAQWERRWSRGNLELPLSHLCRLEPFLWFAAHLLAHLPRFHTIYNQVLHEYRTVNRLRSRTHPVPDLRHEQEWYEAPFWVWREGEQIRHRLFARQNGHEIQLSIGAQVIATLLLAPGRDGCCAVEALQTLQEQGWRFRTRALTTTLFARLCLADLFVHGLGGATYDEMTDRLMTRFFRKTPPGFLMLSGTVRLPLPAHGVVHEDERRVRRQLRELEFHSERYLPNPLPTECAALVEEKSRLIAAQHAVRSKPDEFSRDLSARSEAAGHERYRRLRLVNRQLSEYTQVEQNRLTDELTRTNLALAADAILRNREYSFCLYPAEKLRRFMDHVCSAIGT